MQHLWYVYLISLIEKITGRVISPGRVAERATVTLDGGRIAAIGAPEPGGLDVGDALVLPGGVDVHVHTRSSPDEGIEACTRAAAAGGVTTIVDMPYDHGGPVQTPEAFAAKAAAIPARTISSFSAWTPASPPAAAICSKAASS